MVVTKGFIPLSPLSVFFNDDYVGKQPVASKEYCAEYWLKELQESMDRCTGHRDMTEILLKMALNTIQSINQFSLPCDFFYPITDKSQITELVFYLTLYQMTKF